MHGGLPRVPAARAQPVQDGVLSDAELNAFQVHCFNAPLQPEELVGVKQVVAQGAKEVRALRAVLWPYSGLSCPF